MDVTTSNFGEVRAFIEKQLLPKASYITYDLEFTGLRYDKFERDHINFLPFEKYKKLKYVAQTYQILQLGLSIVVFDQKLKVYPFNFYLFQRQPVMFDKNLTLQLSCVKFNAENGMDWNKWIREGINYVKISEMAMMEDNTNHHQSIKDYMNTLTADFEHLALKFIQKCNQIAKEKQGFVQNFDLPKNVPIQRTLTTLFYKLIKQNNLNLSLTVQDQSLIIKRIPQKQKNEKYEKEKEETYGFALLFKNIWNSKLPFVGHNCNLDLLYIYSNLVAPLPQSYFQFKQSLKNSGNIFYDTKLIAVKNPELSAEGSRLQDLVKYIRKRQKNPTQLALDPPYNRYSLDNPSLHEAGYDSYITAWVYEQSTRLVANLNQRCRNKLNLNNSFFWIDLDNLEDQINPYFSSNILRIYFTVDQKEDVRNRRREEVNILKKGLQKFEGMYSLIEGYRQIFLQIKQNKPKIIKRILEMVQKKQIKQINTFSSYLAWQKQRVYRDYKQFEQNLKHDKPNNYNRNFDKKPHYKGKQSSESNSQSKQPPKTWKKKQKQQN